MFCGSDWSPSMKKPHSMPDNFSFNDPETPLVNGRRENRRERLDDSEITQALQLSDGIADSGDTLSRNKEAISKR